MSRVKCEGELVIKSNATDETQTFDTDDFFFEAHQGEARPMGGDTHHEAALTDIDDGAGGVIDIRISVYEYPSNIVEHSEIEVTGGQVVEEMSFTIEQRDPRLDEE